MISKPGMAEMVEFNELHRRSENRLDIAALRSLEHHKTLQIYGIAFEKRKTMKDLEDLWQVEDKPTVSDVCRIKTTSISVGTNILIETTSDSPSRQRMFLRRSLRQ